MSKKNDAFGMLFTRSEIKEILEALTNDQSKMSDIISKHTKIKGTDLAYWFIKGETITPEKAVVLGIVSDIRSVPTFTDTSVVAIIA